MERCNKRNVKQFLNSQLLRRYWLPIIYTRPNDGREVAKVNSQEWGGKST